MDRGVHGEAKLGEESLMLDPFVFRRPGKRKEEWVLLDPFVFRRDGDPKVFPVNKTTASSSTCIGVPFSVTLDLVSPPSTSRFILEWPGGPDPRAGTACELVAAHRDCILFRLTSIVRTKTRPGELVFPDDYYIYRPAAAHLTRLPACIRAEPPVPSDQGEEHKQPEQKQPEASYWSESDESEDEEMGETWVQKAVREDSERRLAMGVELDGEFVRSSLVLECVGFVCGGEGGGEFVVAELAGLLRDKSDSRKVLAEISILHSKTCMWVHVPQRPIHCRNKRREFAALHHFCTQAAVPFGDNLCWVDHGGGIIIGHDMLSEQAPSKLSFVSLPGSSPSWLEGQYRSVCAADGGRSLKFVDVVTNEQRSRDTLFTILLYKLTAEEGHLKWVKETSMTSTELWGLKAPGRVPHEVPMYPSVSLDKPQVVNFQLSECTDYIDTVTLVTIDLGGKSVISVHTHIKGELELSGEDADIAEARAGRLQRFLLLAS